MKLADFDQKSKTKISKMRHKNSNIIIQPVQFYAQRRSQQSVTRSKPDSASLADIVRFINVLLKPTTPFYARKWPLLLAIAILSVRPSVRHTGGSVKNGPS